MAKRDLVTRAADERAALLALTQKGTVSARQLTRAHRRLQADPGGSGPVMAAALQGGSATGARVRPRFAAEGREAALRQRPRPGGPRQRDAPKEACVLAPACRTPPGGRTSWTLQGLAHTPGAGRVLAPLAAETVTLPMASSRATWREACRQV
jgi:hypothetical protein